MAVVFKCLEERDELYFWVLLILLYFLFFLQVDNDYFFNKDETNLDLS